MKDRVVQMAVKLMIEPIFEADFKDCSYGFRPKRNAKMALETVRKACNWHIHHGCGQILICVGGHSWYQEAGKNVQLLKSGDVVYIAPEIKHWHGAVSDEAFAHLSLSVPKEGSSDEWCEPVTDEEYSKLK